MTNASASAVVFFLHQFSQADSSHLSTQVVGDGRLAITTPAVWAASSDPAARTTATTRTATTTTTTRTTRTATITTISSTTKVLYVYRSNKPTRSFKAKKHEMVNHSTPILFKICLIFAHGFRLPPLSDTARALLPSSIQGVSYGLKRPAKLEVKAQPQNDKGTATLGNHSNVEGYSSMKTLTKGRFPAVELRNCYQVTKNLRVRSILVMLI